VVFATVNLAFAPFDEVIPLSGFSGADIAIVRRGDGRAFVRKAASTPAAGTTLRRQAARQARLAAVLGSEANVPEVLDEGEIDGAYYFDMALVAGRDAVAHLADADLGSVAGFAERTERLLERLRASAPCGDAPGPSSAAVTAKLDEIQTRTAARFDEPLEQLREAAEGLAPVLSSGPTACHGDLTFENILIDRSGGLWLIDAIDSPFEHAWQDWSKLFQDAEGLWHRHRGRAVAPSVTAYLARRWRAAAERQDPAYGRLHPLLLGLTFARILPYARTAADEAFVLGRLRPLAAAAVEAAKGS
jgi:hypothetical protein